MFHSALFLIICSSAVVSILLTNLALLHRLDLQNVPTTHDASGRSRAGLRPSGGVQMNNDAAAAKNRVMGRKVYDELMPSNRKQKQRHVDVINNAVSDEMMPLYHRFPGHGTPEFADRCRWAQSTTNINTDNQKQCSFFVRPSPNSNEGISEWISLVSQGYLLAVQGGCRLLVDYGPKVDILSVVEPYPSGMNWTVPPNFVCREVDNCFASYLPLREPKLSERLAYLSSKIGGADTSLLARVPWYRHAYSPFGHTRPGRSDYVALQHNLPGFTIEDGISCSLGSLFRLSPHADMYEPELYSEILPALHDEDAFVITLYVRTGHTDFVAKKEEGKDTAGGGTASIIADENERVYRAMAQPIINCALSFERLLGQSGTLASKSHIVWSVVTDSPYLKTWISNEYQTINKTTNNVGPGGKPRLVITTSSRGTHTRGRRDPSTYDFAGAFLDWYLLGETDVVIAEAVRSSFGQTGALRTGRTLVDGPSCKRLDMVEEDDVVAR